ncbi:protein takeout isoform X2 [Bombyx mori]|uniref:protein takeout isoform X2 n=1 Tax=Bombyx mori TaxID=7091 RepID=UPI000B3C21C1
MPRNSLYKSDGVPLILIVSELSFGVTSSLREYEEKSLCVFRVQQCRVNIRSLVDLAKKQIQVICHVSVYLKGKYKASGKLLILPITGDGDTTIKLKNLRIQMIYPFNLVKNSEGKDVIDLSSYRYSYDVKDNAHFHMTNLFNGNKQLGDVMLTFMNQNWKALTQEFGKPLLEIPMEMVYNTVKTYLKSQPLEDIANL